MTKGVEPQLATAPNWTIDVSDVRVNGLLFHILFPNGVGF